MGNIYQIPRTIKLLKVSEIPTFFCRRMQTVSIAKLKS